VVAVNVDADVGDVMATLGAVVSAAPAPLPVATTEIVSVPTVNVRVLLTVVGWTGVNRTVTTWFDPASVNGDPETTANGAPTAADPASEPPLVFDRVNVRSTELPRLTVPKFTVPVGLTAKSVRATALATPEQVLSLPIASTALTATL